MNEKHLDFRSHSSIKLIPVHHAWFDASGQQIPTGYAWSHLGWSLSAWEDCVPSSSQILNMSPAPLCHKNTIAVLLITEYMTFIYTVCTVTTFRLTREEFTSYPQAINTHFINTYLKFLACLDRTVLRLCIKVFLTANILFEDCVIAPSRIKLKLFYTHSPQPRGLSSAEGGTYLTARANASCRTRP